MGPKQRRATHPTCQNGQLDVYEKLMQAGPQATDN